ncbi:hypothetical protein [Xanthomonas euvesicatoria]|uniref:hypothetical protein n=1 Tax=Xanthomonas euvesicatoria TaxID=456327 RepID=UPI001C46E6AB|nr:hypothetical protein [Xanthomonas euvesicatoria]MBV6850873.1 hypothetical protein [Xanthomonas campestris pv. heliotropii]
MSTEPWAYHYDNNDNVRAAVKTGTAVAGAISLLGPVPANLATYFNDKGELRETPSGRPAVSSFILDPLTIAAAHSRAAAAGARLLIRAAAIAPRPIGTGPDLPVMQRETSGFSVIKPMPLAVVADGANAAISTALPIWSASVDWSDEGTSPTFGTAFRLSRQDYKRRELDGTLDELLSASILAGVGRAADVALLSALSAASLSNFSLAAAAAQGLRFADLAALVGTAAAGAAVGTDGVLRAAGVQAELTDATAGTFVGAFNRAAVILDREVRVVADRSSLGGELLITIFTSAAALVPRAGVFFRVAA